MKLHVGQMARIADNQQIAGWQKNGVKIGDLVRITSIENYELESKPRIHFKIVTTNSNHSYTGISWEEMERGWSSGRTRLVPL